MRFLESCIAASRIKTSAVGAARAASVTKTSRMLTLLVGFSRGIGFASELLVSTVRGCFGPKEPGRRVAEST